MKRTFIQDSETFFVCVCTRTIKLLFHMYCSFQFTTANYNVSFIFASYYNLGLSKIDKAVIKIVIAVFFYCNISSYLASYVYININIFKNKCNVYLKAQQFRYIFGN